MPTQLTLDNYRTLVERALLQVLRLGFLQRTTVADLTALAQLSVGAYEDGALAYVTSESRVYQLDLFSGAAGAPPDVVAPGAGAAAAKYPRARWLRTASEVTYGPNWRAPLHGRSSGPLRAVEIYTGGDGPDAMLTRCLGSMPAVFLDQDGERLEPLSCGSPGSFYRAELGYALMVFTSHLRGAPSSTWGSPAGVVEPDSAGPWWIIGQLRMVLAGLSTQLGLEGVDRVELGDGELVEENEAERRFVHSAGLRVVCFVRNPDLDLDVLAIDVQPELPLIPRSFDASNFVARGYFVTPGPGLAIAWPSSGVATIAGVSVSSSPPGATLDADRDTYCDLGADGVIYYSPAHVGLDAPALTAGRLRLGYVRTSGSDVLAWVPLCSYAEVFRPKYQVAP